MTGKKQTRSKLYQSYLFRGKDPAIDELRTVFQDAFDGRLTTKTLRTVEQNGGPSVSAMVGWFFRTTKRPQNATIEAAGRAIGMRRIWVNGRDHSKKR